MTVAFLVIVTAWYTPLILKRQVEPAPATFILAFLAFLVASAAHLAVPEETLRDKLLGNVTLFVATIQVGVVLAIIVYVYKRDNSWVVQFDWRQKAALSGVVIALGYWALNRDQSHVTYWATQILLFASYGATIVRAIERKKAFDSIGNWAFITLGSLFGAVPALMIWTWYGLGNSARAVLASGFTAWLLLHYDKREGYARLKEEIRVVREYYRWKN